MLDKAIVEFDKIIKTLFLKPQSARVHPDANIIDEPNFSEKELKHTISLMRINHCGEICAQALYQGQSLTARNNSHKNKFEICALEEIDHLAWLNARLDKLNGKTSILNPLFYITSLMLGIIAGICGDKWSLAFLEETEKQVEQHLISHLSQLANGDTASKLILEHMIIDERQHALTASSCGAANMPQAIVHLMQILSKIMTKTVYYF